MPPCGTRRPDESRQEQRRRADGYKLTRMTCRLGRGGTIAGLVVATLLSGCALLGQAGHGTDQERQQAQAALARWAAAVEAGGGQQGFVPVGELTGQVGDWEAAVGDNHKMALMAGMVVASAPLPDDGTGEATIRWDDGTTKSTRTISATQALMELRAGATQACPECHPLQVTAARLSTATFQTSRGPASAPVWEFTLEGTSVTVTRIAVARADATSVAPPVWDANNPPIGLSIESATGTVGGKQLSVSFTGAPGAGGEPCGADYTAEAVESATAVVVIVISHPNPFPGACTAVGARRTATADLAEPLGQRAVLEVQEGLPVPVTLTP